MNIPFILIEVCVHFLIQQHWLRLSLVCSLHVSFLVIQTNLGSRYLCFSHTVSVVEIFTIENYPLTRWAFDFSMKKLIFSEIFFFSSETSVTKLLFRKRSLCIALDNPLSTFNCESTTLCGPVRLPVPGVIILVELALPNGSARKKCRRLPWVLLSSMPLPLSSRPPIPLPGFIPRPKTLGLQLL